MVLNRGYYKGVIGSILPWSIERRQSQSKSRLGDRKCSVDDGANLFRIFSKVQ